MTTTAHYPDFFFWYCVFIVSWKMFNTGEDERWSQLFWHSWGPICEVSAHFLNMSGLCDYLTNRTWQTWFWGPGLQTLKSSSSCLFHYMLLKIVAMLKIQAGLRRGQQGNKWTKATNLQLRAGTNLPATLVNYSRSRSSSFSWVVLTDALWNRNKLSFLNTNFRFMNKIIVMSLNLLKFGVVFYITTDYFQWRKLMLPSWNVNTIVPLICGLTTMVSVNPQ